MVVSATRNHLLCLGVTVILLASPNLAQAVHCTPEFNRTITFDPAKIKTGESVVLTWTNNTGRQGPDVFIGGGVGNAVGRSGSITFSPASNTYIGFTVRLADGTLSKCGEFLHVWVPAPSESPPSEEPVVTPEPIAVVTPPPSEPPPRIPPDVQVT